MRKQAWRITTILVLALALGMAGSDALAGKGGGKGKPGGGGGGDDGGGGDAPQQEVVFVCRTTKGRASDRDSLIVSSPADGSAYTVEARGDGPWYFQQIDLSPDGEAFAIGPDRLTLFERATGTSTRLFVDPVADGDSGQEDEIVGQISWTAKRGTDGAHLPFSSQLVLTYFRQEWGPNPGCPDAYTLFHHNLFLIPGTPVGAPHDAVALTQFGWSDQTLADGSVVAYAEDADGGTWVGERTDVPNRAWVVYRKRVQTWVPPAGESAWCNQDDSYTDEYSLRVLTLDLSDWPDIDATDVLADELLVDDLGLPFPVQGGDKLSLPVSLDGTHAAWIDEDDGTLRVAPLLIASIGNVGTSEKTLVVDCTAETSYAAPAGQAFADDENVALSHDGAYIAVHTRATSNEEDSVYVLDRTIGTWIRVNPSKYNVVEYGGSLDFGPPPPSSD